jgi:FlaA1/EpsC-like NDP-sugar epimerase
MAAQWRARENDDEWKAKRVLVTGGASFIGSHLITALVETEVASIRFHL